MSIVIIIVWFGELPKWFNFWLESCYTNPYIKWLIFFDGNFPLVKKNSNVQFIKMTYNDFLNKSNGALGFTMPYPSRRRICDMRPFFGLLFKKWIKDYEYFGWGDLDVIYGNLKKFISPEILNNDIITFNKWHLSGSFTILKRKPETDNLLKISMPDWQNSLYDILKANPRGAIVDEIKCFKLAPKLKMYAEESFNNPLSPYTPWRNGKFVFPKEWYWKDGRLTNDIDGDTEFLYLHFMHWKGGTWSRKCGNAQWEKLEKIIYVSPGEEHKGFRINEKGFFPL